jgi:hypothetical protein
MAMVERAGQSALRVPGAQHDAHPKVGDARSRPGAQSGEKVICHLPSLMARDFAATVCPSSAQTPKAASFMKTKDQKPAFPSAKAVRILKTKPVTRIYEKQETACQNARVRTL